MKTGAVRRTIPTGYLVYEIQFQGITPLLMSNGQVDRDSDTYIAYENLAATRKKTREQKAQLRELEWLTRIYHDESLGPFIPGRNLKELLRAAATKTRDGANVSRGLVIPLYRVPLAYDGPRDLKGLWKEGYRDTSMVANAGAGSGRVDRTRPCFDEWAVTFEVAFDQEELDVSRFEDVVARTEKFGLGDYRAEKGGDYGCFEASLTFLRIEQQEIRGVKSTPTNGREAKAASTRAKKVMTVS